LKIYSSSRRADGVKVRSLEEQFSEYILPMRLDLADHSVRFDWGRDGGKGALQLALALLADCLEDDEQALRAYQPFKTNVVAHFAASWSLSEMRLRAWVRQIEKRGKRP
jgi:Family of unknown function (DUF6166)